MNIEPIIPEQLYKFMQIRYASNPQDFKHFTTDRLRQEFLAESLMQAGQVSLVYSHYDRFIMGGAMPTTHELTLGNFDALKAQYFLERRELGIINTGGEGVVVIDGQAFALKNKDCIYVGQGKKEVLFSSVDFKNPAAFFLCSTPAHKAYPVQAMKQTEATPVHLGASETCNERTIYKYIHNEGLQSCQLVMGLTMFKEGSIWNSVPPHTHDRRMEVYFYFDLPAEARVFHFMGQPQETRHLLVANNQGIISPPWSVHFGVGTSSYTFIWAMAGENKEFTDMDVVQVKDLR